MIQVGQFNQLKIIQKTLRGTLLFGGTLGQIYLPANQTPRDCEIGDKVDVFVYRDTHDELIATNRKPLVKVGGVACLKVISTSPIGAFLDWGLPKDLLVPFGEQSQKMAEGESHIVAVYIDNSGRICASSKLNKFVRGESKEFEKGQQVDVIVGDKTDLGFKMIVNQMYWGVLHQSDCFREMKYGQRLRGFIKNVRSDHRLDISLKKPGFANDKTLVQKIMNQLEEGKGFSPIGDKSPPEEIYKLYSVSKKVFKAELGSLYRERKISISKDGIRLLETNEGEGE